MLSKSERSALRVRVDQDRARVRCQSENAAVKWRRNPSRQRNMRMLDFTQLTTQDWIAVGSLAVSTLMLVSNIVLAVVATARTNKKLADWERTINDRQHDLSQRMLVLEGNSSYTEGVLDGAGLTGERGTRRARRRRRR